MEVKQRLRINAVVIVTSVIAVLVVLFAVTHRVVRAIEANKIADGIITGAFERVTLRTDYLRNGNERAKQQVIAKHRQIGGLLKSASEIFTGPEDRKTVDALLKAHESIGRNFGAIVENRKNTGQGQPAAISLEIEDRLLSQLNMRLYETVLLGGKLQKSSNAALFIALKTAGGGIALVFLIVTVVTVINSAMMNRTIASRIGRLREGVSVIGGGDLDHRIDVKGDDEFAELSAAFNSMTAKLKASYHDIEKEVEERKRAEEALRKAHDELELRVQERTKELKDAEISLREMNETLEQRVAERTAELQSANASLLNSRRAALNLMEDSLASEKALRESEERYRNLFNSLHEGFCIIEMVFDAEGRPVDYRFLEVNSSFEKQTGLHEAEGKLMRELAPDHEAHWFEIYGKIALTGEPAHFVNEAQALNRWYDVYAYRVGNPEDRQVAILFNDITERMRTEEERETTAGFLRLINESKSTDDLIGKATEFFQQKSGCEAVGIRLKKEYDYPYYETKGFPKEFVLLESRLCSMDKEGSPILDSIGDPVLECMCGNVICGRFDPSNPFFTAKGSFWSNNTTELLASTTDADRQARTPNRCNGEGYESVGLFVLRLGEERLGLIQLNDHRKGMFKPEMIALWERLADYLAVAVAKFRTEEALKESEEQFRTLADSIPNLTWWANADGYITWYNQRWYEYTGTTPQEMEGWGWQSVHDPEVLPKVLERWKASIATGEPFDMEFPLRGADGIFRPFLTRVMPLTDSAGKVLRWFGTNIDISAMKQAEEALKESERRYHSLFQNMTEGFAYCKMIYDSSDRPVDFIYIEVNGAFGKITGLVNVVGKKVTEVIPGIKESNPELFDIYSRVALTGQPERFEIEFKPLGMWLSVSVYSTEMEHFVAVFDNITERKQAEAELQRLNKALMALSDSSQAVIRAKDEQEYLNEVCRIIVEDSGYSMVWIGFAENDEAKSVRPVAHAGFEDGYLETLRITWADTERGRGPTGTAIRTGKVAMCRNMLTNPAFTPWRDQALRRGYASSIVFPLSADDRVFGAVTIYSKEADPFSEGEVKLLTELADNLAYGIEVLRIRTAQKQAEEDVLKLSEDMAARNVELESVNRELESFIYSISHDLRAPLRSVSGFARIIAEDYAERLDEQGSNYLIRILRGSEKMTRLIDDLLHLSKISRQAMQRTGVDVSKMASLIVAELRESDPDRNVEVNIAEGLTAFADPRLIEIVLSNLLGNAWKFTSKKGNARIELGAIKKGERPTHAPLPRGDREGTVYYVRDNGAGFNPDYVEKMFLPFHRLHSDDEFEGTGIGLTIVERIIHRHGGQVWAEGEKGKGATIYFTLGQGDKSSS